MEKDLVRESTAYEGPTLIIHGTADTIAPVSYSLEAISLYKHGTLLVLDGESHGFTDELKNTL